MLNELPFTQTFVLIFYFLSIDLKKDIALPRAIAYFRFLFHHNELIALKNATSPISSVMRKLTYSPNVWYYIETLFAVLKGLKGFKR